MSTFFVGAGTKLAAGLQPNYFYNTEHGTEGQAGYIADTTVDTLLNITSVTFDPAVEKGTEENLMVTRVKDSSYLLNLTMDGNFSANLRPEMTDWLFKAATQNADTTSGTGYTDYTLAESGNDPLGSTLVLDRSGAMTADKDLSTFPGMVVSSMTLNCPNNDFVSVDVNLTGREEIKGSDNSKIPSTAKPTTDYVAKDLSDVVALTKPGYIVTNGVFKWNNAVWCIESCTISLDNAIEAAPKCYQDGIYANIPVMGRRSITVDLNLPYDEKIEDLKSDYLLTSDTGSMELTFTAADDTDEKVMVIIPALSITSIGSGISGTGVVESTVSGEVIQPSNNAQPITFRVYTE